LAFAGADYFLAGAAGFFAAAAFLTAAFLGAAVFLTRGAAGDLDLVLLLMCSDIGCEFTTHLLLWSMNRKTCKSKTGAIPIQGYNFHACDIVISRLHKK
jgi:hypothetical protein